MLNPSLKSRYMQDFSMSSTILAGLVRKNFASRK